MIKNSGLLDNKRFNIPETEYIDRIAKVQKAMEENNLDLILMHSCECESANARYLANFWPVFDFAGILVPLKGEAMLLTGGPESYDYATHFSRIKNIKIHPLYVESNAPVWDKRTETTNFKEILNSIMLRMPVKRIGIVDKHLVPYDIVKDLIQGASGAEIIIADNILSELKAIKSKVEIELLRRAFRITEEGMKAAIGMVKPGVAEWEIEAKWRSVIYECGAEGTSFPVWVTSGKNTYQSLCRSTDRIISQNDLVQLTFGAKYNGYCGTMCRPVIVGRVPAKVEEMLYTALEALNLALSDIKPGVSAADVYNHYQSLLSKKGFNDCTLYGPAHGTGLQECEGPWIDNRCELIIKPGMVLNLDIWISDGEYGVRFEDGIYVSQNGIEELTKSYREILRL